MNWSAVSTPHTDPEKSDRRALYRFVTYLLYCFDRPGFLHSLLSGPGNSAFLLNLRSELFPAHQIECKPRSGTCCEALGPFAKRPSKFSNH